MAKDLTSRHGPRTIKETIAADTGILLTCDYITSEMKWQAPEAFAACEPTAKKTQCEPLVSLGPHHEWSGDDHDKLSAIGFPVWVFVINGHGNGWVFGSSLS
ncbi:hypothetical protein BDQ12DRAFT_730129 [Crucibulum laeve]|uniref:Uncharacterized protein n=1 Tax=Crucibulum laeve TaxID=68775 RepID=A0A5C3LCZ7_9AGAR|nr:hypothetical protein BDQ12DRAFT_730129 [Crucibulum laeve]